MKRAVLLAGTALLATALALPVLAGVPDATYLDTFAAQNYSGNDGDTDFSGPWVEIAESNGPTVGYVWVWDHPYCNGPFCLKLGGIDQEAAGHGAMRAVDLSGATWAQLSFDYGLELLDDDSSGVGAVQVSPDGGETWATLKTISLDNEDGGLAHSKSFDITQSATPYTLIRFIITEAEDLELYWMIDNVMVEASFEGSTTTTSTTSTTVPRSTTTSTSQPPTTSTTTKPKTTTTTTTKPKVTTTSTSQPPERTDETTTTTTVARSTTTTVPTAPGDDLSDEDHDMMMNKDGLTVVASSPPLAMPAFGAASEGAGLAHAEPVEALAAAFFTDAGNYGGNLLPSVVLGIVIAVVALVGIGSRKQD